MGGGSAAVSAKIAIMVDNMHGFPPKSTELLPFGGGGDSPTTDYTHRPARSRGYNGIRLFRPRKIEMHRLDNFRKALSATAGIAKPRYPSIEEVGACANKVFGRYGTVDPGDHTELSCYAQSMAYRLGWLMKKWSFMRQDPRTEFEEIPFGALARYQTDDPATIVISHGKNRDPEIVHYNDFLIPTYEYAASFTPSLEMNKDLKTVADHMIEFNDPSHKVRGLLKPPKAASMRLVENQPFQDGL